MLCDVLSAEAAAGASGAVLPAPTSPCNHILSFVTSNRMHFGFVLVPGEFIMNSVSHSCRKESKAWGKKKSEKHYLRVSVEDDEHHILNGAKRVMI